MAFAMADARQHPTVRHELFIQPNLLINRLHQRYLIVAIVDSELFGKPGPDLTERRPIAPQQPHAKRVKGGEHRRIRRRRIAQQAEYALAHLVRGFVGKRDGQYSGTRDLMILNQMCNPVRNYTCFAATGSG